VRVAFKRLWDDGLAYRGEALVNWCPRCRTTISDLENAKHEETGSLWTVRYHLVGPDGEPSPDAWISVATTRPETILGDTAVAVHPDDDRFRHLVGREAVIPFVDRHVPIIADEGVERDFGTGAVKITPAHDFDDHEMARRHGLPMITVLDEDARMSGEVGPFAGMDRYEARSAILERLAAMGDLEGEKPHQMVIGRCDRCGTVVEPRLSVQWFINVKPLAERALASVREGRTRILPVHFEKVFAHWMENIHDWAVGRQLWWGHRIPAWFCPDGHITVSDNEDGPDACAECGRPAAELTQETDIFDTWFSSGLWPFSTLGWPDRTPDLARFYPTSVMETAYEILFFWVARMMMLGLYLTDAEPFHTVYLHGIVRDPTGSKMSKTKGNVVDPLEMISEIGADALRLALVSGNAPGVDQRLTESKLTGGRNFTNKLWNAARFVIGSRPPDGAPIPHGGRDPDTDSLAQAWIRSRLAAATHRASEQLDRLDLSGYVATVHEFAWSEYCDWYLEMAKVERRSESLQPADHVASWRTSAETLAAVLALLHPVMPFVTEAIWERLHALDPTLTADQPLLAAARWPSVGERASAAEAEVDLVQELIRDIRDQRTANRVPAGASPEVHVQAATPDSHDLLQRTRGYVCGLARVGTFTIVAPGGGVPPAHASNSRLGTSWLVLDASVDDGAGEERRRKRESDLRGAIARLRTLLGNASFVERAPAAVVERERARLEELESQLQQLSEQRA
jgi:valyl-tRNA synthetase